jgi:hypothetical protein
VRNAMNQTRRTPAVRATRWLVGMAIAVLAVSALPQGPAAREAAASEPGPPESDRRRTEIDTSTDVAWLQRIATSPAFAAKLAAPPPEWPPPWILRQGAYLRLGSLGTPDSLAAVAAIEAALAKRRTAPATVNINDWPREENRYGKGLAELMAADGTTYRVVFWNLQGPYDLFLTSSRTPRDRNSWTRPSPIGTEIDWPPPTVTIRWRDEDRLLLRYTTRAKITRERVLSLAALRRDTDGDGWTDDEERGLGLNPRRADSDGDGIRDGADICPLLPATAGSDARALAIQRVFFARFGFLSGHAALRVMSEEAVHVFGYGGPVLFGYPRQTGFGGRGATYVYWTLSQSGDEMFITIGTWQSMLSGEHMRFVLKRLNGQWFVVGARGGGMA